MNALMSYHTEFLLAAYSQKAMFQNLVIMTGSTEFLQTGNKEQEIIEEIKKLHTASFEIYGSPKITVMLHNAGLDVSQKTVAN